MEMDTPSEQKKNIYIYMYINKTVKIVLFHFWKGVYSKRKEFAPKGSKFFPFRVDLFLNAFVQKSRKSQKNGKNQPGISNPLEQSRPTKLGIITTYSLDVQGQPALMDIYMHSPSRAFAVPICPEAWTQYTLY